MIKIDRTTLLLERIMDVRARMERHVERNSVLILELLRRHELEQDDKSTEPGADKPVGVSESIYL